MARKLTLGGKAPQTGFNVSHSHIRTKKRWMPNIQRKNLFSSALSRSISLTISTDAMRSLDKVGGLDEYLLLASVDSLTRPMRRLREQIQERRAAV
ncbi:MAG: 50S ribosomal protein L28 [Magnetococcus sp. DMHC-6]